MIRVYTMTDCMPCKMTKRKLDELGLAYEEINMSENAEAADYIKSLGYTSAPVVVTENVHWSGFCPEKIRGLGGKNIQF